MGYLIRLVIRSAPFVALAIYGQHLVNTGHTGDAVKMALALGAILSIEVACMAIDAAMKRLAPRAEP